jgi:hypothetical protein
MAELENDMEAKPPESQWSIFRGVVAFFVLAEDDEWGLSAQKINLAKANLQFGGGQEAELATTPGITHVVVDQDRWTSKLRTIIAPIEHDCIIVKVSWVRDSLNYFAHHGDKLRVTWPDIHKYLLL